MSPSFNAGPRRLARHALAALTAAMVLVPALPAAAQTPETATELQRIVVAYDDQVITAASASTAPVTDRIPALDVEVIEVPADEAAAVLRRLAADGRVRWAEADVPVQADVVAPNDPLWQQQWGPRRIGTADAWEQTTGSADVTVAILDSGVDARHPDLRGAVLPGRSFVPGTRSADDDNGHGTSAAGIVAARGGNGNGIAGMCWSCQILPVKVLDAKGSGTMSSVAQGLVWAADQGAQVASLSLSSTGTSRTIADAVDYATRKGMLVFASAGNTGTTGVRYPAGLPDVVSVAGTSNRDDRYDWSTYGDWVDLAAPGCNLTTRMGGGTTAFCGTSSATPLVAGAAALAMSVSPRVSPDQVADALSATATSVRFPLADGRIDLGATVELLAVELAASRPATPVVTAPTDDADRAEDTRKTTPTDAPTAARPITRACPSTTAASSAAGIGAHGGAATCLDAWGIGIFPLDDFRSSQALTRAEFAGMLDRMLDATGSGEVPLTPARFGDLTAHRWQAAVERLAGLGVISGFGDGTFRPDQPIRRDQMATLMTRVAGGRYGLALPVEKRPDFTDVGPTAAHAEAIAQLATSGITAGAAPRRYDPAGLVTRGQTATFTARLLDLLIAEGHVTAHRW